jgi:hypothetical protein
MKKLSYIIFALSFILAGCGSKNNPAPDLPSPDKALLIFPEKDAICTTGTLVSATTSSLTLKWNAANNTDSYDVTVKNLLTGTLTTQTTTKTELTVNLLVNTPYSWVVTSKSSKVNKPATSDTWKFYNSGPGIVSYAPFPAEIVAPNFKQNVTATNGKVTLDWNGSDVDGDIVSYDVYFDTKNSPAIFKAGVTDSILNDVAVTSGSTYYWRVITKDSKGNSSDSGVFQFTVN